MLAKIRQNRCHQKVEDCVRQARRILFELRIGLFSQLPSIVLTILSLAKATHVQKYKWDQAAPLLSRRSFRDSKPHPNGTLGQSKVAVLQCIHTVRDDCQALLHRTQIAACAHAVILSSIWIVGETSP